MSLIQEALKRQQMEQEGKLPLPPGEDANASSPLKSTVVDGETFILPGMALAEEEPEAPAKITLKRNMRSAPARDTETPPPAPVTEAPVPPPSEPERKRISPTPAGDDGSDKKKPRVLPSLAAVIILLLLLAGALVWAVIYGLELAGIRTPWSKGEAAVTDQPVTDPAGADAAGTGGTAEVKVAETPTVKPADHKDGADATAPAAKPTIGSVVRQTVKDATAVAKHADVVIADAAGEKIAGAEPPSAAAPVTQPPPVVTATAPEPPIAAVPAVAPTAPEPPAPVKWPDITISGVVGKELKGAVFVGGKVYGVNETVSGIRIVAIKSQGALLEYQGETRLAKVGQPINRATR